VRADADIDVSPEDRKVLLDRFGMFGIRMSSVVIRSGCDDSTELADELYRRSGMEDLLRLVSDQFRSRSDALKARTAIAAVRSLLERHPTTHSPELAGAVERLEANAHELRELALLSEARTAGLGLPPREAADAERLIGGSGASPARRLGLPDDASPEELRTAAREELHRWRAMAGSPLRDRAGVEACQVVIRSCEALMMGVAAASTERRQLRLVLQPEPTVGPWGEAQDPGGHGQREAGQDE
jgi:hypothetical protein